MMIPTFERIGSDEGVKAWIRWDELGYAHAAGPDDLSPRKWPRDDSKCAMCFFNAPHTEAKHKAAVNGVLFPNQEAATK